MKCEIKTNKISKYPKLGKDKEGNIYFLYSVDSIYWRKIYGNPDKTKEYNGEIVSKDSKFTGITPFNPGDQIILTQE